MITFAFFLMGWCGGVLTIWGLDLFFDAFGRRALRKRLWMKAWERGFRSGTESAFECQINVLLEEAKTNPDPGVRLLYAKWLTLVGPLRRKAVAALKKKQKAST